MRKLICVLDTETTMEQEIFDFGFIIADVKGNVVFKRQYIIAETFKFQKLFFENLRPIYIERLKKDTKNFYPCFLTSVKQAFEDFTSIINKYNVKECYAYNMAFDSDKIFKMSQKYGIEYPLKDLDLQCLWLWATQKICTMPTFKKWALDNNRVSEKGYISTNAENVYAFIKKDDDFKEEHTALEDSLIEYQIYLNCKKKKANKNRLKGIMANCWLIPQPKDLMEKAPLFLQTQYNAIQEKIMTA